MNIKELAYQALAEIDKKQNIFTDPSRKAAWQRLTGAVNEIDAKSDSAGQQIIAAFEQEITKVEESGKFGTKGKEGSSFLNIANKFVQDAKKLLPKAEQNSNSSSSSASSTNTSLLTAVANKESKVISKILPVILKELDREIENYLALFLDDLSLASASKVSRSWNNFFNGVLTNNKPCYQLPPTEKLSVINKNKTSNKASRHSLIVSDGSVITIQGSSLRRWRHDNGMRLVNEINIEDLPRKVICAEISPNLILVCAERSRVLSYLWRLEDNSITEFSNAYGDDALHKIIKTLTGFVVGVYPLYRSLGMKFFIYDLTAFTPNLVAKNLSVSSVKDFIMLEDGRLAYIDVVLNHQVFAYDFKTEVKVCVADHTNWHIDQLYTLSKNKILCHMRSSAWGSDDWKMGIIDIYGDPKTNLQIVFECQLDEMIDECIVSNLHGSFAAVRTGDIKTTKSKISVIDLQSKVCLQAMELAEPLDAMRFHNATTLIGVTEADNIITWSFKKFKDAAKLKAEEKISQNQPGQPGASHMVPVKSSSPDEKKETKQTNVSSSSVSPRSAFLPPPSALQEDDSEWIEIEAPSP